MHVTLRQEDDRQRLEERIRAETNAVQRDRLRSVLLALAGQEALPIARTLGRARRFVQEWVYAYRDGGLDAVRPKPPGRRPPKLAPAQEAAFKQRMLAGPTAADGGVCTLRGVDAQRILAQEFGVQYTLQGTYDLLHRLGLACLTPRPRHRKNDPEALAAWVQRAPLLSRR
jgi:transposase